MEYNFKINFNICFQITDWYIPSLKVNVLWRARFFFYQGFITRNNIVTLDRDSWLDVHLVLITVQFSSSYFMLTSSTVKFLVLLSPPCYFTPSLSVLLIPFCTFCFLCLQPFALSSLKVVNRFVSSLSRKGEYS